MLRVSGRSGPRERIALAALFMFRFIRIGLPKAAPAAFAAD
jgi:hypothetical protein